MKTKIFLVLMLLVASLVSCDNNNDNEIKSDNSLVFSLHRSGGWTGLDEKLEINAKSTHYSISYHDLQTSEPKGYQTTIETSGTLWNNLIKTFDLETFTKIQDGACASCVDGIDETFSVTKDGKTYSFYNGAGDKNYQKMQEFFDEILKQVTVFESIGNNIQPW